MRTRGGGEYERRMILGNFSARCYHESLAVKNRRSLTPVPGAQPGDIHATRRGGARHELSARVSLKPAQAVGLQRSRTEFPAPTLEGWALNVSRGGLRVILEEKVELGAEFEITISEIGAEPASLQSGRIVWVQEEPDGVVAGIEFRSVGAG
jgi:PilZ domain-containing protein